MKRSGLVLLILVQFELLLIYLDPSLKGAALYTLGLAACLLAVYT